MVVGRRMKKKIMIVLEQESKLDSDFILMQLVEELNKLSFTIIFQMIVVYIVNFLSQIWY